MTGTDWRDTHKRAKEFVPKPVEATPPVEPEVVARLKPTPVKKNRSRKMTKKDDGEMKKPASSGRKPRVTDVGDVEDESIGDISDEPDIQITSNHPAKKPVVMENSMAAAFKKAGLENPST